MGTLVAENDVVMIPVGIYYPQRNQLHVSWKFDLQFNSVLNRLDGKFSLTL